MSCASSFGAVFAAALLVIAGITVLIIIFAVKNSKNGSSADAERLASEYKAANTFPSAPAQTASSDGEAHKCASCGASYEGARCPYCGTPAK